MRVGFLKCTPEGLEAIARAGRVLGAVTMTFEVHAPQSGEEEVQLCTKPEAGWIDLLTSWEKR